MDAVFYPLDAMRLFRGKSLQEIKEITFEIGMLRQHGLDINDPQESHILRALPGRTFSVLEPIGNGRRLQENGTGDGNYAGCSPPTFCPT